MLPRWLERRQRRREQNKLKYLKRNDRERKTGREISGTKDVANEEVPRDGRNEAENPVSSFARQCSLHRWKDGAEQLAPKFWLPVGRSGCGGNVRDE